MKKLSRRKTKARGRLKPALQIQMSGVRSRTSVFPAFHFGHITPGSGNNKLFTEHKTALGAVLSAQYGRLKPTLQDIVSF
jgi:hypothetical protein